MKAFILAAGMGIRLKPYSEHTPKPLFPVGERPLIDRIIRQLESQGFNDIAVNLHHLSDQIVQFINHQHYQVHIHFFHELQIRGTGGAIKNLGDFWNAGPLLVINSDILTDIDLRAVYEFHVAEQNQATLVMHNRPEFNTVTVDKADNIIAFSLPQQHLKNTKFQAFTGIQVIEPEFIDYTPEAYFFSSISVYEKMIAAGRKIRAYRVEGHFWEDLGTPERYLTVVSQRMARDAFKEAFGHLPKNEPVFKKLKGDGSDRKWYRVSVGEESLVAVKHGIRPTIAVCEADAFINIGHHLHDRGLPVPRLYTADPFSGIVFLEDLGSCHLQNVVQALDSNRERGNLYRQVIDKVGVLSLEGARDFDLSWPYQTASYDHKVILEFECAYFVREFLHRKMGLLDITFTTLKNEFKLLANKALQYGITGFMHRDCQSRNLMLHGGKCYFIDFQAGRIGPVQYDLASLLVDPYVELTSDLQDRLETYARETHLCGHRH